MAGCSGAQSALAPQGPDARVIASMSWIMFAGAAVILSVVMLLALYAIYRAPRKARPLSANALIMAGGVVFPVLTLTALLVYGVQAMAGLRETQADNTAAMQVDVTGHQWWWEVRYRHADGRVMLTDANELHIPAGVPVAVSLRSDDVIHSFWVPTLAGKMDLIPGRTNRIVLQADQPGVYRGQCAEFCGAQHARMAFVVIARTKADHDAWLARLAADAAPPATALTQQGMQAFRNGSCAACHTVRGHGAADAVGAAAVGIRGPDLTHVGARGALLANTLPNTRENLAAIIARSQQIKPGNRMPSHPDLDAGTLDALAAYLESLQ
jgi:cytochrome c oxidase subunit 2